MVRDRIFREGRNRMKFNLKNSLSIFFLTLTFWSCISGTDAVAYREYQVEGYVSVIQKTYLYLEGQRYFLDPKVKFTLYTDYGRQVSAQEIVSLQWIARARLHIRNNKVTRVTILKLEQ